MQGLGITGKRRQAAVVLISLGLLFLSWARGGTGESEPEGLRVWYEGQTAPGSAVRLRAAVSGEGEAGAPLRWVQVSGVPVALRGGEGETVTFRMPESQAPLRFLVIRGGGEGLQAGRVEVPVDRSGPRPPLRADAGEDHEATLGRPIALVGGPRSEGEPLGFRWIQVGGPPVRRWFQEGAIIAFEPEEAGEYRFALVVARGAEISVPDEVRVRVRPESQATGLAPGQSPARLSELAGSRLRAIGATSGTALQLAEAFRGACERSDLYSNYQELQSELSRRLESILPVQADARRVWEEQFFMPLTTTLIDTLKDQGLDLSTPAGRASEFSARQRDTLANQFRALADGCQAAGLPTQASAADHDRSY